MRAGRPVHHAGSGDGRAQRHAGGDALGRTHDVGFHAPMLDSPPLPRSADARLHLVDDQQDAVSVAQAPQGREEIIGGNDVAAFPKNWLHHHPGAVLGRKRSPEQHVLDVVHNRLPVAVAGASQDGSVGIGERDMGHARNQGGEAAPLHGLAGGDRQGPHRAAMEATQKSKEVLSAGMMAGQLERHLDGLRAGVSQEDARRLREGSDGAQSLREFDP